MQTLAVASQQRGFLLYIYHSSFELHSCGYKVSVGAGVCVPVRSHDSSWRYNCADYVHRCSLHCSDTWGATTTHGYY